MRILLLSNLCPPFSIGGYEIACANVAAGLRAGGHEICLATGRSHLPGLPDPPYVDRCFDLNWFHPSPFTSYAVHQYSLFMASISDFDNTLELLRLLRRFSPDLVYVWNVVGIGGTAMLDLLNILDVPWVLHLMDDLPHHLLGGGPPHVHTLFGGATADILSRGRVISMSQTLVDEILEATSVAFDGGIDIVPGWVDLRALPDHASRRPATPVRFVSAGRVAAHKGIDLILDAAASLVGQGLDRFEIDIYGEGEVPHYIDIAQRLGLQTRARFLGQRSQAELFQLYPEYHAFLFPTWEREPFGFAPIEAAACGCVPILTRQCGAAERLVNFAHCLKIDRTTAELATAMRRVIEGSVDLEAIARRATAVARGDLGFDRALDRINAILEGARRAWDRSAADDPRLPLLLHTKHQLAHSMMFML